MKSYRELFENLVAHIEHYLYDNEPSYLVLEEKAMLDEALLTMYDRDIPDNDELVSILEEKPAARRMFNVLKEHPYRCYII